MGRVERLARIGIMRFEEKRHGYELRYTATRLYLQRTGTVRPAPRRGAHRRKPPRRPMRGMLLHQDGSKHAWLAGQPALDLSASRVSRRSSGRSPPSP